MNLFGLTGNIGSGKSTVTEILSRSGFKIIDADLLAREVLNIEEVKRRLLSYFSDKILDSKGEIDRKKLASFAFSDEKKTNRLNQITHPQIRKLQLERISALYLSNSEVGIVYSAALLFEVKIYKAFQKNITVAVDENIRKERLVKLRGMEEEEIKVRLSKQMDQKEKIKLSDYVINNNSSLQELKIQVKALVPELKKTPQISLQDAYQKFESL